MSDEGVRGPSSGAIGRRLLPVLVQAEHSVVAMTRSAAKAVVQTGFREGLGLEGT